MRMSELLAEDLGMTPGEIIGFCAARYQIDIDDALPVEVEAVRYDLDEHCVRSVPDYWWPETPDPTVCRCPALGGLEHAPGPDCPMVGRPKHLPGT